MRYVRAAIELAKRNPFPSILIGIFVVLSGLGISGSSMGAYDQMVTDETPGVIVGQPRPVRSDEWLWQSQDAYIQKINNFPAVNETIGLGQDMSMILDVPFSSFFTLFKPHNLFFFVLPFAVAFAAKWWIMSLVLCLGFYFLFDSLFPKKRLLVSLGALLIVFNPFTQWWYQSITLLSIGYGLWAAFFAVKLFSGEANKKRLILYSAGLAYTTLCFAFLLYPPFQLPVIYVVVALLAGFFYHRYRAARVPLSTDKPRWIAVGIAAALVVVVAGSFFVTHKQVLDTINHTVYPAVRNIQSGESSSSPDGANFNLLTILSAPTLVNLQHDTKAVHFYTNQSEAARIVAISLLIAPIALYQVLKKPRKQRQAADYMLLTTGALAGIFMLRLCTPLFDLPFKLLLFNKVQNERLAIGLVVLCAVQLILMGVLVSRKFSLRQAALGAAVTFLLFYDGSLILSHQFPGFITDFGVLVVSLLMAVCAFLMLQKKLFIGGLVLFVLFNIWASALVNPLYARHLPSSLETAAAQIGHKYTDNKTWGVLGSVTFENVPLLAGKHSLSGIQYYPQLKLWQALDPGKKEINMYNRFSHVTLTTEEIAGGGTFWSPQPDVLHVKFDCTIAQKLPNFGYMLSSGPLDAQTLPCLKLDSTIPYPLATLYIYKYVP